MELLSHIFGEQTVWFYLAAIFFLLLGQVSNKIIVYNRRGFSSPFDIWYWLKDNWFDVITTLVLTFITVRFTDDIVASINKFAHIDLSYIVDSMFYYFVLGLVWQTALHWLRKKLSFLRSKTDAIGLDRKNGIIRPDGTPLGGVK